MASLNFLIKPISGQCNLICEYCFYKGHNAGQNPVMSESILETVVEKAMDYCDEGCTFLFQGGEPTLCGLGFYEKFVEHVEVCNTRHIPVDYMIQTNGQLLDPVWADFFASHNFMVGVSVDGTRYAHDKYRKRPDGKSSFDCASAGIKCLQQAKVEYSILITVTDELKGQAEKVYRTWVQNGWNNIHIIPCMPDSGLPKALSAHVYAEFINTLFDLWFEDLCKGRYTGIRLFENYVRLLSGGGYELCGLLGKCAPALVIEQNGECYPCDFYVREDMRLGSIETNPLNELLDGLEKKFLCSGGSGPVNEECKNCQYLRICGGGCRRYRDRDGRYVLCDAMKAFFEHCFPRLVVVARNERNLALKK